MKITKTNIEARIIFTEEELQRMKNYEKANGQKIIYSFKERCEIYRQYSESILVNGITGINRALYARLNLDNADIFDGPDDSWKQKTLEENLRAIKKVLEEKVL